MKIQSFFLPFIACFALMTFFSFCSSDAGKANPATVSQTARVEKAPEKEEIVEKSSVKASDIKLVKDLLYDKYTLTDTYPYKDTTRSFQWEKIKSLLAFLENEETEKTTWGYLENYRHKNGQAPLIRKYKRNEYKNIIDSFGVERYQGVPLYAVNDSMTPVRYGLDGSIVKIVDNTSRKFVKIEGVSFDGTWNVPRKYLSVIGDTVTFRHVIVVDIKNQNITTLQQTGSEWKIRSMNPATSGRRKPPHAYPTPTGMFLLMERKYKMFYYKDGTTEIAGYAPYANRFTRGAYIHGVPTNDREAPIIEYSASLGTTPRSHMCVRNASSHAKFIYNRTPLKETVVFVID